MTTMVETPDTGDSINLLGFIYSDRKNASGRYPGAVFLFLKAVEIGWNLEGYVEKVGRQ
jgi:hypothetical protein